MEKRLTDKDIYTIYQDILDHRGNNQIIVLSVEGPLTKGLRDFINQSADSILYDLNRDEATTVTLAKSGELDIRFINDLAVATTIIALKDRIEYLERTMAGHIVDENNL